LNPKGLKGENGENPRNPPFKKGVPKEKKKSGKKNSQGKGRIKVKMVKRKGR